MSLKCSGFTYIECIVSLSIVIIAASLLFTSLSNCYELVSKNSEEIDLINLANAELEDKKYRIRNSKVSDKINYNEIKSIKDSKIEFKIEEAQNYYRCYKIKMKAYNKSNVVELTSYVTK